MSSKRYFLIEKQNGGCDYTIACGTRISEIHGVSSMLEAIQKVVGDLDKILEDEELVEDEDYLHDYLNDYHNLVCCYQVSDTYRSEIRKAEILEVNSSENLHHYLLDAQNRLQEIKNEIDKKKQEKADRAKYEELKKRFG